MDSDWFTRIYRSILAEQNFLQNRDMAYKLGCGPFLSPQISDKMVLIDLDRLCRYDVVIC